MATRFLISVKCRPRRSFHHASCRRDVFSHPRSWSDTRCVNGLARREKYRCPERGRAKRDAEISRDCGNKKESCGGNGERTRETTETHETRDDLISSRPSCVYLSLFFSSISRVSVVESREIGPGGNRRTRARYKNLRLKRPLKSSELGEE